MAVSRCLVCFLAVFTLSAGFSSAQVGLPSGMSHSCQNHLQDCLRTFQANIFSRLTNPRLMCGDIDTYGKCLGQSGCGVPQEYIDQQLQTTKKQLEVQGTLDCSGHQSSNPAMTLGLPGGQGGSCQTSVQTCLTTFQNDVLSHAGNPGLMCRDLDIYGQCLGQNDCGVSREYIDQQVQLTKNRLAAQGTLDCNGQTRLPVTGVTGWLLVAAIFLATKLPAWM